MVPKKFIIQRNLYNNKIRQPIENPTTGQISPIGQILIQLQQPTLAKNNKPAYLISDIPNIAQIAPFTMPCNGRTTQTDLTTFIMNTPPDNEDRITRLLERVGIEVNFQD